MVLFPIYYLLFLSFQRYILHTNIRCEFSSSVLNIKSSFGRRSSWLLLLLQLIVISCAIKSLLPINWRFISIAPWTLMMFLVLFIASTEALIQRPILIETTLLCIMITVKA